MAVNGSAVAADKVTMAVKRAIDARTDVEICFKIEAALPVPVLSFVPHKSLRAIKKVISDRACTTNRMRFQWIPRVPL